jgi:hypothetical protein
MVFDMQNIWKKFSLQRDFSCAPVDCYFGQRIQNIPNTSHLASVKWHMPLRIRGMRKRPGALPTPERFSSSTYDLLRYGSVWSIKNYFFKYGAGSQVSSEFWIRTLMDSRNFWIRFQIRPKNSYTYSMPMNFRSLWQLFKPTFRIIGRIRIQNLGLRIRAVGPS